MRDSRRKACMLLLASAGLLPTQAPAALDGASRLEVVRTALGEARTRLELERFLLRKLEGIGDSGISPSYLAEVDASKERIFEARALVLALERLERELLGPPSTPSPTGMPSRPSPTGAPGRALTASPASGGPPRTPGTPPGTSSGPSPTTPPSGSPGSPATAPASPAPPGPVAPS